MAIGGYEMVVDLEAHKYACKKWQLSGIPCYHACACIAWSKKSFESFIHVSYSKDMFLKCYSNIVEPICGESEWKETSFPKPFPPEVQVQTGRPKKKRNKASDVIDPNATKLKRQNSKVKCTYCTELGHNIRTCPARAADRANGCEKQVKTRTKSQKKAKLPKEAEVIQSGGGGTPNEGGGGAQVSDRGDQVKAREPNKKKAQGTKQSEGNLSGGKQSGGGGTPNEGGGSQGGVLKKKKPRTKLSNTPLGIQPQQFQAQSNNSNVTTTSMANIEARRSELRAKLRAKPVWKI